VTYHLAPPLVAAVPAVMLVTERFATVTNTDLSKIALTGMGGALAVTLFLSAVGKMAGPSLLPTGGATLESVLFSVIGGVGGFVVSIAIRRRRQVAG